MLTKRFHFETIDSTNSWCKRCAEGLNPNALTLVSANEQTGGRGRYQRRWFSPSNQNIYASFVLFVDAHRQDIGNFSQLMAITTVQLLKSYGVASKIKWPNDILVNGSKIAGILTECVTVGEKIGIIIGIGLNVQLSRAEAALIDQPSTSMLIELERRIDPEEVLTAMENCARINLITMLAKGFAFFLSQYRKNLLHLPGDNLFLNQGAHRFHGSFEEIAPEGALTLLLRDGDRRSFVAGEIECSSTSGSGICN